MPIFKRKITEQILSRIKNRGLIIILGPRQAGKTTLVKSLLKKSYKIFFIDNGVRNIFANIPKDDNPAYLGTSFESLIFSEFLKKDTLAPYPFFYGPRNNLKRKSANNFKTDFK